MTVRLIDQLDQPFDSSRVSIQVNVYEAKAQLSKLIEQALGGDEVIIARAGKPVVRLVRWEPAAPRVPGS